MLVALAIVGITLGLGCALVQIGRRL